MSRWWPFRREERSYTSLATDALWNAAVGNEAANPDTFSAAVAGSQTWARAMASATIDPSGVLTSSNLWSLGLDLAQHGESVWLLGAGPIGPTFDRVSSWYLEGGPDRESWQYRVERVGPTSTTRMQVGADRIAHVLINESAERSWEGRSPLTLARESGRFAVALDRALGDESNFSTGQIVSVPEALPNKSSLQTQLGKLRGKTIAMDTLAHGRGDPGSGTTKDLSRSRLGPEWPAASPELRNSIEAGILGLFGVHPALLRDAGQQRESYRQLLRGVVAPLGRVIEAELGRVLRRPVSLSFGELRAGDVMASARAWRSLVGQTAALPIDEAKEIVGLS